MHVVIFEGIHWTHLAPLSLSRPVFMLRSGAGTLLDKQIRFLKPDRLTLWVRPEMVEYCQQYVLPELNVPTAINLPLDDEFAFITSGRTLLFQNFEYPGEPAAVIDEGNIIRSAYVQCPGLSPTDVMERTDKWLKMLDLPRVMPQARLVDYPWDLLNWNEESLVEDSVSGPLTCAVHQQGPWHLINDQNITLEDGVKLSPGVVLDASSGPIMINHHARIGPLAVIQGPVYIGEHTQIQPHTFIRPGTTIGPHCRMGGEISNAIVQGCTSKSHYGYLGDSYVGEWVNLGAGTSTSNLKNTYDEVEMQIANRTLKTGRKFVGSMIGDHAKTAIGTRLMTGSYVGYSTQIARTQIPPKYTPSFTWMSDKGTIPYRQDKAIAVMKAVFARRNRPWTSTDASMVDVARTMAAVVESEA